jgi:hypothetical protein
MIDIKFKFVVKGHDIELNKPLVTISDSYTLDSLIDDVSTEDILSELESGCDGNSSCQVNGFCECGFDFENAEIISKLQYTGRKDKNGEELYDGDIVERDNYKGIVVFEMNAWRFQIHEDSFSIQYPSFYSNANTMCIIGNINIKESKELIDAEEKT